MLRLLLLTCFVFPMLYSASESTELTLSEDEQHALNIKNFRPGYCGYVSDECRATHDAVFPPLEVTPADCVRIAAWMQKKGFNLQSCCAVCACATCVPFVASSGTMLFYGVGCYTLAPATANATMTVCFSTLLPSWISTAMCLPIRQDAPEPWVPGALATLQCMCIGDGIGESWQNSPALQEDKKVVAWASDKWRAAARVSERTSLLEKPQPLIMRLDRDEA